MKSTGIVKPIPTSIGRAFVQNEHLKWASVAVSAVVITLDLLHAKDEFAYLYRMVLTVVGCLALFLLAHRDPKSLGLTLHPAQGWRYWLKRLGAFFLFTLLVAAVWLPLTQNRLDQSDLNWKFANITEFWQWWVLQGCIAISLIEEFLYRVILCSPMRTAFGAKA